MTPERWARIEDLYHRALEVEKSHRAAFLRDVCADDGELGQEVERLLAEEEQVGSFLEEPALKGPSSGYEAEFLCGSEAANSCANSSGQLVC